MSMQKKNRRRFIRESAAGLVLALAGPGIARSAGAENSRTVRLGFVGVGSRGTVLLRLALMMDGVEIPAVCDINDAWSKGMTWMRWLSPPRNNGMHRWR